MRALRPLALGLVATALLFAACSSATPGWTYAPAPSMTPPPSVDPSDAGASAAPSGDASAAPSGDASAAPSGDASAAPSGDASAAPSGGTADGVQISAVNIAFEQSEVTAPVDTPFQIQFANNDPGVPHNVEIKDEGGASVFMGEVFNGVETRTYEVPALTAGAYTFICTVHPNMTGTLTAG